jgi:catechol 2,3-dioxygenase-like lactoylglutathione lyase family enzyme
MIMTPILKGIDHVHVYTKDRAAARSWFDDVMAMTPIEKFLPWAEGGGPLTLADPTDTIHIALFERESFQPTTSIAFGASGEQFLSWKSYFEAKGIALRIEDHDMAYSLYFYDPDINMYEITTYDADLVRKSL